MNELAGNLPRKFISFRHLGVESSTHKLPEKRESGDPQNLVERKEAKTIGIGATSNSPAKCSSNSQDAPVSAACIGAKLGDEDRDWTIAEKDCILTNSDDDVEDLSAFVTKKLQSLSEAGVEELIGDASVNVAEILCGNVDVEEEGGDNRQCMRLNVTFGGDVDVDDRRFSPGVEINQFCGSNWVVQNFNSKKGCLAHLQQETQQCVEGAG